MTRVIIVDDDLFVRSALADLLSQAAGVEIVGTYDDGDTALAEAACLRPDVALVDIAMPRMNGPQTTRELLAISPATRVLALTSLTDPDSAAAMLSAGAIGFLPKDLPVAGMAHAIGAAHHGIAVMAGAATPLRPTPSPLPPATPLSDIERRILAAVVAGQTNSEIARLVFLSPSTVKHQVSALMNKLGASNRVTLAIQARALGLG